MWLALSWEISINLTWCCSVFSFNQPNLAHLFRSWLFKPPTWHSILARLFVCSCLTLQCSASNWFRPCLPCCFPGNRLILLFEQDFASFSHPGTSSSLTSLNLWDYFLDYLDSVFFGALKLVLNKIRSLAIFSSIVCVLYLAPAYLILNLCM